MERETEKQEKDLTNNTKKDKLSLLQKSLKTERKMKGMFLCLFGVFRPTREYFTHMDTSILRGFFLCSALKAIEQ